MSLFKPIEKGDLNGVLKRLKSGASLKMLDQAGNTPLQAAIQLGHTEIVKALLAAGAEIGSQGESGATALHTAIEAKSPLVRDLLDAGADPNETDEYGATPLHIAASVGDIATALLLLDLGVELEAGDGSEATALDCARETGQVEFALWLMSKGASTNGWTEQDVLKQCRERQTYYESLTKRLPDESSLRMFDSLLAVNQRGVEKAIANGANVNSIMPDGATMLSFTLEAGPIEAAKLLIDCGANVDIPNPDGYTPLMMAALDDNIDVIDLLLGAGADVNVRPLGVSALDVAIDGRSKAVIRRLVKAGADTRGLSLDDLLAEADLVSESGEGLLSSIRPVMGKRIPANEVSSRAFREIEALGFKHEASLTSVSDSRFQSCVLASTKHKAYALVSERVQPYGLIVMFVSLYDSGAIYVLTNASRKAPLMDGKAKFEAEPIYEIDRLLNTFLSRRLKEPFYKMSWQAFVAWLLLNHQPPPNSEESDND